MTFSRTTIGGVFVAILSAIATSALAQHACEPFEVHYKGTAFEGQLIDHDGTGRSAGDIHIGSWVIANNDGEQIGLKRWHVITLDENTGQVSAVISLPAGDIHAGGLITGLGGASNEGVDDPEFSRINFVIHGGTGAFEHASGTVATIMEDDGPREIYTIKCE